jgi:predicted metal-dependent hydrolase
MDPFYTYKKSSRSRHIRITIKPTREVIVTVPRWVSLRAVERFVKTKEPWIQQKIQEFRAHKKHNKLPRLSERDYKEHKARARQIITARVDYFGTELGLEYNRIAIRNQSTRWGSCSSKNNLNFNYKLVFLPDELRDYVIVHELCHLREMNHSSRFWALVEDILPDYRTSKRELMTHYRC